MIFRKKQNALSLKEQRESSNRVAYREISPDDFDFKELFRANYPMVLRHAMFIVGDRTAADDIAQETFIKLYQSPPREFTNLSGWLLTVATNIAYNNIRSEKNRKRREVADAATDEIFEENFDEASEIEYVRELLGRLDERDRICLVLKFSGFSYDEIARITGINKGSVGKVLARALEKFKRAYEKEMA